MRLPYASADSSTYTDPDEAAIFARIVARRHPRPPIPLDLALLRSPPVADGWNAFLGRVRTGTTLDAGLQELAICRVAVLNAAAFEWAAHAPLALKGRLSRAALEAVLSVPVVEAGAEIKEGGEGALDGEMWAVLAYTDQMTRLVKVDDGVFANLVRCFGERMVVEFTATVAAYNCVSRFLVALDVGEMNGRELVMPAEE